LNVKKNNYILLFGTYAYHINNGNKRRRGRKKYYDS